MVALAAAADQPNAAVHLAITGTTATTSYIVWRAIVNPSPGVAMSPYVTIYTGRIPAGGIDDPVAPFNEHLRYVVTLNKANITQTSIPAETLASDELTLSTGMASGPVLAVIDTTQGDFPILRAPLKPELGMVELPVLNYSGDFMLRGQVHEVIGSPSPIVSADVMQLKSGELQFATSRRWERQQFVEFIRNPSVVLHLRAPCVDGAADDLFFVPLEVRETVPEVTRPDFRIWIIEFQQVNRPWAYYLPAGTRRVTWGEVKASGRTWGAVKVDYANWLELRYASTGNAKAVTSTGPIYEGSV